MDELGVEDGRAYHLFVRVPPALKNCRWAGLDVAGWLDRRLVDVLIPSQLMTLAHDMPIDEFVAIARPAGCKVYPSLYPRTSYTWPFAATPSTSSYASPTSRLVSPELVRGAASNYRYMGASGFQLFNFTLPPDARAYQIVRDIARPATLTQATRTYAITPAYYLDYEDSYQYKKHIPIDLKAGTPCNLPLIVGEDLTDRALAPPPDLCALRLGMRGASPDLEMSVRLNGVSLHTGAVGEGLVAVTGSAPADGGAHPDPPSAYLQLPLSRLTTLNQGLNTLELIIRIPGAGGNVSLVEVQLGVVYLRDYRL